MEWKYQQAKFKPHSAVWNWLEAGLRKEERGEWSEAELTKELKAMGAQSKPASYMVEDEHGHVFIATGLLAQLTSLIVRNRESPCTRKRIQHILEQFGLNVPRKSDMATWYKNNVNDKEEEDTETISGFKYAQNTKKLMLKLLREKYQENNEYGELLLSTGTSTLHETKGRRKPGLWEYGGGDLLGELLTQVRDELNASRVARS